MNQRGFITIVVLGITLVASFAARQGIFEYWKAGTKRRSHSTLPQGRGHTPPAATKAAPAAAPWTNAWFSDSTLVRRRIREMADALRNPMIGQTFPLPRGGGFVCSRTEGSGEPASNELVCAIECTGPELGGRRHNWFYVSGSNAAATLERVRWVIHAPPSAPRASWRRLFHVVADSLSRTIGVPAWSGPDSTQATWRSNDHTTTVKVHGTATQADSLEMECLSDRLVGSIARGRKP